MKQFLYSNKCNSKNLVFAAFFYDASYNQPFEIICWITKLSQTTYYLFIQIRHHLITQQDEVRNTGYSHVLLQEKMCDFLLFYETLIGTLFLFSEHSTKFPPATANLRINFTTLERILFQIIFIFMDDMTQKGDFY